MTGLEGAGIAGDLLSWIGLGLGVPLLLVGLILRSAERALVPVEIVIVRGDHEPLARWFAQGDFHERALDAAERAHYAGRDVCTGYSNPRNPSRMRLERRTPSTRVCLALGATFTVVGLTGLVLSVLPMVFA